MSAREPGLPSDRDRPPRDRLPGRGRHRDLPLRAARAADPARGRGDRAQAAADRHRARRELRRLHALRGVAARQARACRPTSCATSRSRCSSSSRRRCSSRGSRSGSSGRSRACHASAPAAAGSCSASRSGSCSCPCAGPVLAAVTVVAANNDVGWRAILLTLAYALGAAVPMAADRLRRQGARGSAARARRAAADRVRASLIGARRARIRLQRRHALPDRAARLHRVVPEARRAAARPRSASWPSCASSGKPQLAVEADAARAARPPACPTTASRRALEAERRLVQHEAADAAAAARQGRADRLLDVLVHQLPAHAAAPEGVGRRVPLARARDRRRAHAGVRVRARRLERARRRQAARRSSTRSCRTTSSAPGTTTRTSTGRPSTCSTARATSATSTSARAPTTRPRG